MLTKEHEESGSWVRRKSIDSQKDNPYVKGGTTLEKEDVLCVRPMAMVDGIPVPQGKKNLPSGLLVAAADYFTSAGWYQDLKLPKKETAEVESDYLRVAKQRFLEDSPPFFPSNSVSVLPSETTAFIRAYQDFALATHPDQQINQIDRESLADDLKEFQYLLSIKDYDKKLKQNAAHFTPWATRAYIVGHKKALEQAQLAYAFSVIASGKQNDIDSLPHEIKDKASNLLNTATKNPTKYGINELSKTTKKLAHRFYASAVAMELFTLHFYSDHFAAGHLRLGELRTKLPQLFGDSLGGLLVNAMHNEDNAFGVRMRVATLPLEVQSFAKKHSVSFGDGSYDIPANDTSANNLVNGMMVSLAELSCAVEGEAIPVPTEFKGAAYLPQVDMTRAQTQPLFIQYGENIYYRRNYFSVRMLSPEDYKKILKDPPEADYAKLSSNVIVRFFQGLRLFWSAQVLTNMPFVSKKAKIVNADEFPDYDADASPKTMRRYLGGQQQPLPTFKPTVNPIAEESLGKAPSSKDNVYVLNVNGNGPVSDASPTALSEGETIFTAT